MIEYRKNITDDRQYDCVVCGGGMTGFAAAIAASRKGLKTAIVEKFGCLGGVATSAGVNHLLAGRKYNDKTGNMDRKVGGIFDELTDRLIESGSAIEPNTIDVNFNPFGWYKRMAAGIPFDEVKLKILLDEMCAEEGIDIYFFTNIIDIVIEDKTIKKIILHNKSGLFTMSANVYIDCTGDADIAHLSECETKKGRTEDGLMTPTTLIMHVDNVDSRKYVEYQNANQSPKLIEIIDRLKKSGEWTFPYDIFIAIQLNQPDVFMINTMRQVGYDGTSGDDLTRAMIDGRKENVKLFEIMKKHFPGFENARIRKISDVVGIRETRRIVGEYLVTIEDALSGRKYHDTIATTTYNFDLPDPLNPSYDPMMGDVKNPNAERKYDTIEIPYRSLVVKNIDNLIVAGRSVSVEREVLGPVRIMGPCMFMGQAAGIASFLASKFSHNYKNIDTNELRDLLIEDGCLLIRK